MSVGTVHTYLPKKTAFEFNGSDPSHKAANVILFIGGLTDGLLTVHYLPRLAEAISQLEGDWGLVQGLLTSSYMGWGHASLEQDNYEISKIVSYLRSPEGGSRKKIVLMGHSTGCQDTIHYLSHYSLQQGFETSSDIDGAILQAPVSDREGLANEFGEKELDALVEECHQNYISKGLLKESLPLKFTKVSFGYPINAYRFYSLYSKNGDDDYFSTYLTDEQLASSFGKIQKPLLCLYGEKDEYVPDSVDRQALIDRWSGFVGKYWSEKSKILNKASHTVDDNEAVEDMLKTIKGFIETI